MPNTFAYIVLFTWPLVVWALFRALPIPRALAWSIIGGYLLLPTRAELNLPVVPSLNKDSIPGLAAALMCVVYARHKQAALVTGHYAKLPRGRQSAPRHSSKLLKDGSSAPSRTLGEKLLLLMMLALVLTPFLTVLQNAQPVIAGPTFIPGLRIYDGFSMAASALILIIPFLLAQRFLATPESHRILLKTMVQAGVAYSFLVLFEVRMSPQLNNWLYGFFPHDWIQHLRGSGFRPVVFLPHGLALGLFLSTALIAAVTLWREELRAKIATAPVQYAALWIALALMLSKNGGALALAILFVPIALFAPSRAGTLVAACVAAAVLTYPALRGAGWIPTDTIARLATSISEERGGSLQFRLDHEDMLLARANVKPVAGWGGWGRGRVYDPDSGRDLSVSDGWWIITIGISGWAGYLATFGLLACPIILIWHRQRRRELEGATLGLMLIVAIALIDAIPNAFFGPVYWLFAGALAGRYRLLAQEHRISTIEGRAAHVL
jgi:hypothetical protein